MYLRQATAGKNWKIATMSGHDVHVSPFFLILIGLFVFMGLNSSADFFYQLMWAPVLFFSILFHELGHAAATKKCGFGTSKIILHGFGGVAISRRGHTKPNQGMFIALAGPGVTLIMALLSLAGLMAYGFLTGGEPANLAVSVLGHFLLLMTLANVFWLILNLLPIYPMDGGQTMMHFLRKRGARQNEAIVKSAKISLVAIGITAFLTLALFQVGGFLIIIIFAMFGYMNWQILQQAKAGGGGAGPMRFG